MRSSQWPGHRKILALPGLTKSYDIRKIRLVFTRWGLSSAGRARHWQCRGQRFDPARLHQSRPKCSFRERTGFDASHSSSGPGHCPFTAVTGVRTPYGTPPDSPTALVSIRDQTPEASFFVAVISSDLLSIELDLHRSGGFGSCPLRYSRSWRYPPIWPS